MAVISKSTHNKCWRGHGAKGALPGLLLGMEIVQPLWRTVRKTVLKTELLSDLVTPLLDIYLEKKEPEFKKTTTPHVFRSTKDTSHDVETTSSSRYYV